jgi:hypothetical protein
MNLGKKENFCFSKRTQAITRNLNHAFKIALLNYAIPIAADAENSKLYPFS